MLDGSVEIRSFGVVFDLERRIHRIDRFRIPLPYGLPLRSVGYAALALLVVLLARRLPVLGPMVLSLPTPAQLVVAPCVSAYWLTSVRVDGRTAHAAAACLVRYALTPRRLGALHRRRSREAVWFTDVRVAPDACGHRIRAGTIAGPASVLVRHEFRARQRGRGLHLWVDASTARYAGKRVVLRPGQRLVIR